MKPWPYPLWIAHRGAGKLAPENTLAAFRVGASYGYRMFECDVKLSADGMPFLLHDATLERTVAGENGAAGQRSWAELARMDAGSWHSRAYAGEPLPSFAAIARYVVRNRFALDIEIKPSPGHARETGRVVGTETLRLWAGNAGEGVPPPLFSSFEPEALEGAAETAPDVTRALLLDELWDGWFEVASGLGCAAVVTNRKLMDAALVAQLHRADMHALAYTVNDGAEARRLVALGVVGICTDAVDRFAPGAGVAD